MLARLPHLLLAGLAAAPPSSAAPPSVMQTAAHHGRYLTRTGRVTASSQDGQRRRSSPPILNSDLQSLTHPWRLPWPPLPPQPPPPRLLHSPPRRQSRHSSSPPPLVFSTQPPLPMSNGLLTLSLSTRRLPWRPVGLATRGRWPELSDTTRVGGTPSGHVAGRRGERCRNHT